MTGVTESLALRAGETDHGIDSDSSNPLNGDTSLNAQSSKFGRALRKDFLFDDNYLNLNHGSFGAYPNQVREALRRYQDQCERYPDRFIRYEYAALLDKCRAALAKLLHAPLDTIVIVPNATTAVNTVLRNLQYRDGDVIIYFDAIYGACEKVIAYMTETTSLESVKIAVAYPVSDADLVAQFRETIYEQHSQGKKVKLALFDTISSMPGVRMPFAELSEACKELGVLSVVDGAHGVGHLDLRLEELDFDFFVSNCHKWLYVPRSCAVFYVPERNQHLLPSTLPTSHGFVPKPKPGQHILNPFEAGKKSPFVYNFEYVGTLDGSPYLCVVDALEYRESIGGEAAIRDYCLGLNRDASKHMAKILGTEVMDNVEGSLTECFMSMVKLPLEATEMRMLVEEAGQSLDEYDLGVKVRDFLTMTLVREHSTFMALTVLWNKAWWVRLSATVYLDMNDFDWAGKALHQACGQVRGDMFITWLKEKAAAAVTG